jgi:hypothetical protein
MCIDELKHWRAELVSRHARIVGALDDLIAVLEGEIAGATDVGTAGRSKTRAVGERINHAHRRPAGRGHKAHVNGHMNGGGRLKKGAIRDMVRQVLEKLNGPFKVGDVQEALRKRFSRELPEQKIVAVSCQLLGMLDTGELKSEGTGQERTYRVVKLKTGAAAVERSYNEFRRTVPEPPAEVEA